VIFFDASIISTHGYKARFHARNPVNRGGTPIPNRLAAPLYPFPAVFDTWLRRSEPRRVCRMPQLLRKWSRYEQDNEQISPEVRARAARMVFYHQGDYSSRCAPVSSIAAKIGCTAQTLNEWVKKAEVDDGSRPGLPSDVAEKMKALEWENRELRRANEILRKASAYFAMALDRSLKRSDDFVHR